MKLIALVSLLFLTSLASLAQPEVSNQPLTLQDLNLLLRRSVGRNMTEGDLAARVQRLGLAFAPTPEMIGRLRFNGAHPHLLNVIKRAGEKFAPASDVLVATKVADPFIEEVRRNVKDYVDSLPDFICTQEVERFVDLDGSGGWQRMDALRYELAYNRKQETYKPVAANGLLAPRANPGNGASSAGEFASALDNLFDPATEAIFTPAGKEKLGTHQTLIYDYHVTRPKSKLDVKIGDDPTFIAAYSGSVWIDVDTKQVLRIEQAIEDPPAQYRTFSGDKIIDYEMVKLRGTEIEVLLPIKAEITMLNRAQKSFSRNVIYFKFYRKFETDIKFVTSDDTEEKKPEKPPNKPDKPAGAK